MAESSKAAGEATGKSTGTRLKGKTAFVTGAASGIGLASAKRFAQEGASVFGADLKEGDHWAEVASICAGGGAAAGFFELDVRELKPQEDAAAEVVSQSGAIDICMTAAGIGAGGFVHMLEPEDWQRVIDINLTGTMYSAKACLPAMISQKSGSIITVASVEGIEGCEGGSGYNASKGGVILLTKNLSCDYGRQNIRANAICPGFIKTPMFDSSLSMMDPAHKEGIKFQHKLGRWGEADEIAGAALFLASDDSSFVSGVALPVDGGYTAGHFYGMSERIS